MSWTRAGNVVGVPADLRKRADDPGGQFDGNDAFAADVSDEEPDAPGVVVAVEEVAADDCVLCRGLVAGGERYPTDQVRGWAGWSAVLLRRFHPLPVARPLRAGPVV